MTKRIRRILGRIPIAVLSMMIIPSILYGSQGLEEEIQKRSASVEKDKRLIVAGQTIYGSDLILQMLEHNGNLPLWNDKNRKALVTAIGNLGEDGLMPGDYRFPQVEKLLGTQKVWELSAPDRLDLDFLLSETFLRAAYNLAFGKVDAVSLDPDINFTRSFLFDDPALRLLKFIVKGQIEEAFELIRPKHPSYRWKKEALAHYRGIAAKGGWPTIENGPLLKPGMTTPRVVEIRKRLEITGENPSPDEDPHIFDEALVVAVEQFQENHELDADGMVGPSTLAAMNVPVEKRIDQLRVNLERDRWVMHEIYDELLVVDLAGFEIFWVKDGQGIWKEKVQIGKEYTKTPLLKSAIHRIVLNPDWTIPPGIIQRSILPAIKKDPGYLEKKGYLLLTPDGDTVDPATVDWDSLRGFPYIVRQPPGPENALGLVKFLFPNPHYVYLHDTNHRDLFDRKTRTFSSGCIRLNNPMDLAELLLDAHGGWDRMRLDEVVASGETTSVKLAPPMRIVIVYRTALVREGDMIFRPDIYDRDPAVLEALNGPFTLRRQDL